MRTIRRDSGLLCVFVLALAVGCEKTPKLTAKGEFSPSFLNDFIATADSIYAAGGRQGLEAYVAPRQILAGSAIYKLLDRAIQASEQGDSSGQKQSAEIAKTLAEIYREQTGVKAPLDLWRVYTSWDRSMLTLRKEAAAREKTAQGEKGQEQRRLLSSAAEIYGTLGDEKKRADVFGSVAISYYNEKKYDSAPPYHSMALKARRRIHDLERAGASLNGSLQCALELKQNRKALSIADEAIEHHERTGDVRRLVAASRLKAKVLEQLGQSKSEESLKLRQKALSLAEQYGLSDSVCDILLDFGITYSSNGNYGLALTHYEAALAIDPYNAVVLLAIAGIYNDLYQPRSALRLLESADTILASQPGSTDYSELHRLRGIAFNLMGEYTLSEESLLLAHRLSPANAAENKAFALFSLAELMLSKGANDRAEAYGREALALGNNRDDKELIRRAYFILSQIAGASGNYELALEHLNKARRIDRKKPKTSVEPLEDDLAAANFYTKKLQHDKARKIFRALASRIIGSGRLSLIVPLYLGLGDTFELAAPDSAQKYYEKALAILEDTRSALAVPEIYSSFLSGETRMYYEQIARFYARTGRVRGDAAWRGMAFQTFERGKARGLLELMSAAVLLKPTDAETSIIDSLKRIQGESEQAKNQRRQLMEQLASVRAARRQSNLGAMADEPVISGIQEIQRSLPEATTLLEYALCDTSSMLWVVSRKDVRQFDLPDRRLIERAAEEFLAALSRPGINDKMLLARAEELYKMLISPAEEVLGEAKNLAVVPDGLLFYVPFEILLAGPPSNTGSWKEQPFLFKRFVLSYVPSGSVLVKLLESKDPTYGKTLLAFGDPDFSVAGDGLAERDRRLLPLPGSRAEVNRVASMVAPTQRSVYLGRDANLFNARIQIDRSTPRIVFFATHAIIDSDDPANSYIALSPDGERGDTGKLSTLDILSIPFRSEIAVLSACETARGKLGRGEGVIGLSRSFIAAGTRSLVVSQWPVSDAGTASFMERFFNELLRNGLSAPEALNAARRLMVQDNTYSHPYYWAPFVAIGSPNSPWPEKATSN